MVGGGGKWGGRSAPPHQGEAFEDLYRQPEGDPPRLLTAAPVSAPQGFSLIKSLTLKIDPASLNTQGKNGHFLSIQHPGQFVSLN